MVDELLHMIAQAINGPYDLNDYHELPNAKHSLSTLRHTKWQMLTRHEQAIKYQEAQSIVHTLKKKGVDLYALLQITPGDDAK